MRHIFCLATVLGLTLPALSAEPILCAPLPSALPVVGGVELLYWKACEQGVEYGYYEKETRVINVLTEASSELLELQPSYGWGFRLFAGIGNKCNLRFAEIEWVRFQNSTTIAALDDPSRGQLTAVGSTGFWNTQDVSAIRVKQQNEYNNLSLKIAQCICRGCWGCFYGYLGGGWKRINVHDWYSYEPASLTQNIIPVMQQMVMDFSAGAVLIGLGTSLDIGCGFGVDMRGGLSVLIGDLSQTYESNGFVFGNSAQFDSFESPQVNCITGYEFIAAIYYNHQVGCACVQAKLGYWMDYFFSLSAKTNFLNSNEPAEEVNRGYGGPFIGFSVCY